MLTERPGALFGLCLYDQVLRLNRAVCRARGPRVRSVALVRPVCENGGRGEISGEGSRCGTIRWVLYGWGHLDARATLLVAKLSRITPVSAAMRSLPLGTAALDSLCHLDLAGECTGQTAFLLDHHHPGPG